MRALFVTPASYPGIGGLQSYCHNLCQQFAAQGDDVLLFTLQRRADPRAGQWLYRYYPLRTMKRLDRTNPLVSAWRKLCLFWHLLAAACRHRPDFIFCISWDPLGYLCVPVARLLGIPYCCAAHGQEILAVPEAGLERWAKAFLRDVALRGAGRVFAVSRYTRDRLLEIGIPAARVSIIPPGTDGKIETVTDAVREAAAARLGLRGQRVILQVSRLVPRKAHDDVIASLPAILRQEPGALYAVVGDGPERGRLEALAAAGGVSEHVLFAGRVTDETLADWYRAADVFVMACRTGRDGRDFEGFGIVFLEAYRYGKPVVAGRAGGVEDVVVDGATGFLVEPGDTGALASRILRLLSDTALAEWMGREGQRMVEQVFDWRRIALQMRTAIGEISSPC